MSKAIKISNLFSKNAEVIILCDKSDLESIVSGVKGGYKGNFKRDSKNKKNTVTIQTSRNCIHFLDKADWDIKINEQTNP